MSLFNTLSDFQPEKAQNLQNGLPLAQGALTSKVWCLYQAVAVLNDLCIVR